MSNRLEIIYSESSCQELSIDICMGQIGRGGGGRPGGGPSFLDPPSKILLAHSYKILIYQWNPQLTPSRLAPFLSKLG